MIVTTNSLNYDYKVQTFYAKILLDFSSFEYNGPYNGELSAMLVASLCSLIIAWGVLTL